MPGTRGNICVTLLQVAIQSPLLAEGGRDLRNKCIQRMQLPNPTTVSLAM